LVRKTVLERYVVVNCGSKALLTKPAFEVGTSNLVVKPFEEKKRNRNSGEFGTVTVGTGMNAKEVEDEARMGESGGIFPEPRGWEILKSDCTAARGGRDD
jgi:hypothetical protein